MPEWQEQMSHLDSVISRRPLKEDMRLFRATSICYVPNANAFILPQFISTSTSDERVSQFFPRREEGDPALMAINCLKGAYAAYMERLQQDESESEEEYLLPRNSKFKVNKISEVSDIEEIGKYMGSTMNLPSIQEVTERRLEADSSASPSQPPITRFFIYDVDLQD